MSNGDGVRDPEFGPRWIESHYRVTLSPFGRRVAQLLDDWAAGVYHLPRQQKTDWTDARCIEVVVPMTLATFDVNDLTLLVFLAHDYCIRVSVSGAAPRYLRLMFHPRERAGGMSRRHPTLDDAVEAHRRHFPGPDTRLVAVPLTPQEVGP